MPVNCGHELYDVITITDNPAGLNAAKRRIVGIGLRYSVQQSSAVYEERILLGAP